MSTKLGIWLTMGGFPVMILAFIPQTVFLTAGFAVMVAGGIIIFTSEIFSAVQEIFPGIFDISGIFGIIKQDGDSKAA